MLKVGDKAPDFELQDDTGRSWRLEDLRGQKVILYFYPKDDTPGCTAQACDFRDNFGIFQGAGYIVLGVSPQDASSHGNFRQKYDLNFPLLIDEDKAVAEAYGVWGEQMNYGRKFLGIRRSTFVIDEDGTLIEAQYGVKARGHVDRLRSQLGV
jgi:thioredoxin-dependent peroxiredoxin